MNYLPFKWSESVSLEDELAKPFNRISVKIIQGNLSSVTLLRLDKSGVKIYSEMHDIAEREEVGVLNISLVSELPDDELVLPIGSTAFKPVAKLIIHESGTSAESGLVFMAGNKQEIVIVAADFPYDIAIRGALSLPISSPEYSLDQYQRVPFIQNT